ncbi:MAG: hypothetical protein EON60_07635 [Alphaproteobacteria bacterium]|nr:MAG: hypothetical protein EON60_07635 [Alphaproteobacteria bacterium]
MEFTPIERAVVDWCAANASCAEVAAQFLSARPTARRYTGVGSYTDLAVPTGISPIPVTAIPKGLDGPLIGPDIVATELELGACTQIYCADGVLTFLEIAAYGDSFPEHLSNVLLERPQA